MKVCILGNNLSALTLAKSLVNQKIYVDLLSQKKDLKLSNSRTIGISKSNSDFFNKEIIEIKKLFWQLKKIEIFSDNLKQEKIINFEDNNNQLFSIIRNNKLYDVLKKKLSKNKYFKKRINTYKNLSLIKNYDLIINCDYSHPITKKYFSKKIIKKYNCFAYTTIIKHESISNNTAIQIFTKNGPLAFLPISANETSIVYSIHNSRGKIHDLKKLIKDYNYKYKINKIEKINSFELKSLNLRSYFHDNILAFGDLLHRVHPLAGQGFNMTIRDVRVITKIIKNRIELGLPLDSSVNDEFENILKHKNFIFSNGIDFIHEFFNIERRTKNNILSKSVQFLFNKLPINKLFIKAADEGSLF